VDGAVELGLEDEGEALLGAVEVGAELGLDEGALDDGAEVGSWPESTLAMARKRSIKYTTRKFMSV
jgi:hypothetical protein